MITINSAPTGYNWSKNNIVVRATTDKFLTSTGVKSQIIMVISNYTAMATAADTFNLSCKLFNQKFSFNQSYDNSATNIKYDDTVVSNTTARNFIANRFIQNYQIAKYYNVFTSGANNIVLIAKTPGTDFNLTATYSSSNFSFVSGVGANQVASGVKILVQVCQYSVLSSTDKSFAKVIGSRNLYPDKDGIVNEDVSDIIDDNLISIVNFPITDSYAIFPSVGKYFIAIAEVGVELNISNDTINEIGILNQTSDFYVVKGGISKQVALTASFDYEITSKINNFLSNYSGEKNISPETVECLFVIPQFNELTDARVYIGYTLSDGSTGLAAKTILSSGQTIYQIAVGFNLLGLSSYESPEVKITKFYVELRNSSGAISSRFHYKVDRKYYKNKTTILLQNSKGAYEVFVCHGETKNLLSNSYTSLSKVLPAYFRNQDYEQTRIGTEYSEKFIVNTGHLKSRLEKKWLTDLILTGIGYVLINGYFYPIIITSKEIPADDSTAQVFSFDIEFMFSYTNTSFNALSI